MKLLLRLWAATGFTLTLFGIFWLPKDIEDRADAAAPWKRWLDLLDQNAALWVFALLATIYIVWIAVAPPILSWLRGRRPVFTVGNFTHTLYANGGASIDLAIEMRKNFSGVHIVVLFEAIGESRSRTLAKYDRDLVRVSTGETPRLPIASLTGTQANSLPKHKVYWGSAKEIGWMDGDRSARCSHGDMVKVVISAHSKWFLRQTSTIFAYCIEGDPPQIIFFESDGNPKTLMNFVG